MLLQFELITLRFGYMRTHKTIISTIPGFPDVSLSSKTLFIFGDTKTLQRIQEKTQLFKYVWKFEIWKIWKDWKYVPAPLDNPDLVLKYWNYERLKRWKMEISELLILKICYFEEVEVQKCGGAEKIHNLKTVSEATEVMKINPKATISHQKWSLKSW